MTDYEKLEKKTMKEYHNEFGYLACASEYGECDCDDINAHNAKSELLAIKSFLSRSLAKAYELGGRVERDSWIDQKANQHDERIRNAERQRIVRMLNGKIRTEYVYCGSYCCKIEVNSDCEANQIIDDIIKEIGS